MANRWMEIVLEGPRGWTIGFVQGYVAGRLPGAAAYDAELEGCDVSSVRERIRELVDRAHEIAHVLVAEDAVPVARESVEQASTLRPGVDVRLERWIGSARFSFSLECYSRESAERIRQHFRDMPEGVRVSAESRIQEFVDPEASGAEVYAPVHDFELTGSGALLGDVEGIVRMHRLLANEELVDCGEIRLVEV